MTLQFVPKLILPPGGRETIRAARNYAETGKFIPFLTPTQVIHTKAQLIDQERLGRVQEILNETEIIETLRLWTDPSPEPSNDLDELQAWFAGRDLPDHPVRLNDWTTIADIRKAVAYHLEVAKINLGKPSGQIDLNHLREILTVLEALEQPP